MIPAKSDLFQRCQSVMPMENLTYQSEQSDWSKKELTPTEVAEAVLANQIEFDSQKFDKMVIIDARYDYEYSGGHIKGTFLLIGLCQIASFRINQYTKNRRKCLAGQH